MRKLSQINEGLWKPAINRAKTGEKRIEDKLNCNIDKLKPIDIGDACPVYIADVDLILNGDDYISFDVYEQYKDKIEETGWRMPGRLEMLHNIWEHCVIDFEYDKVKSPDIWTPRMVSHINKEKILFTPTSIHENANYWLEDDEDAVKLTTGYAFTLNMRFFRYVSGQVDVLMKNAEKNSEDYRIRLVRDKK